MAETRGKKTYDNNKQRKGNGTYKAGGQKKEWNSNKNNYNNNNNNKRKLTSQESHAEQKKQKLERRSAHPDGELKLKARKIWEQLRRKDLDSSTRKEKMTEMMTLIQGKIKDVTFKHDMSRIIQTCIKYGNADQRSEIAEELDGTYVELSRSIYGRYILISMLKNCPKYRQRIIEAFYGSIRKLIRHKEASVVVEECFAVYANARQRWNLAAEFYGNEFAVFKDESGEAKSLAKILDAQPQKRETILQSLKRTVTPLLEKGTIQHSIVHRALLDYIRFADPKGRAEIIESLRELVVEILHTKDGAHAGMLCLLYGTAKDRKAIVKAFKPYLQRICCEEYGYGVLIQALDCVDDTVFMGKTVLQDICEMANELIEDKIGRRVILYVLAGRNPMYVGSEALKILREGDSIRKETSRKDPMARHGELTAQVSEKMNKWAAGHLDQAIFNPMPSQVVGEVLIRSHGDKSNAWNAVLDLVKKDVDGEDHVLVNPTSNRVVTNCIIAEHTQPKTTDDTIPLVPESNPKFGTDVLNALIESGQLGPAAVAGAFPVRALLESPVTAKQTEKGLGKWAEKIRQAMENAEKKKVYEAILKHLE